MILWQHIFLVGIIIDVEASQAQMHNFHFGEFDFGTRNYKKFLPTSSLSSDTKNLEG
jgi:hypothetical protein